MAESKDIPESFKRTKKVSTAADFAQPSKNHVPPYPLIFTANRR